MSQPKSLRIEFDPESRKMLEDIREKIGAKGVDDVVAYGIDVLRWVVEENRKGHRLQVAEEGSPSPRPVRFTFLPEQEPGTAPESKPKAESR